MLGKMAVAALILVMTLLLQAVLEFLAWHVPVFVHRHLVDVVEEHVLLELQLKVKRKG